MKKFLSFIVFSAIILNIHSVFAQNIIGEYSDGTLNIENGRSYALLNIYSNDVLCGSYLAHSSDGKYSFDIPETAISEELRLVYANGDMYDVTVQTPPPVQTPTPAPQPTKTPRPDVYEKASDALHAPAVVTSVSEIFSEGENRYMLSMLYQGNEITASVGSDISITAAPKNDNNIVGKSANCLSPGDIIHFNCDLQGRIKNIQLIYRPDFINYIADGVKLNSLCGSDGYSKLSFGIPVKTTKHSITVADENGKINDIDVHEKAFIYSISQSPRDVICELSGIGSNSVDTVYVNSKNTDDIGNILSMKELSDISFVLIRSVRNTATEIFVFEY